MGLKCWSLKAIALALLAYPFLASASLGEDAASVQTDRVQMSATMQTAEAAHYTLFEIQTPSGIKVREYVSSTGRVFAVAWEGPTLPDLRQLLGSYFSKYVEGATAQGPRARPLVIEQPGLVVYAGGRMRSFRGRAVVPGLIPDGLGPEQIL
jgi:hypothetical protein